MRQAIVRIVYTGIHDRLAGGVSNYTKRETYAQLLSVHDLYRDLIDETIGYLHPVRAVMAAAVIGGVCVLARIAGADRRHTENFCFSLATGENLHSRSPVLLLRNRLLAERGAKHTLNSQVKLALIIKAWNAYVLGVDLTVLRHRTEGEKAEDFPRISGGRSENTRSDRTFSKSNDSVHQSL
jgi:hypothetical protein